MNKFNILVILNANSSNKDSSFYVNQNKYDELLLDFNPISISIAKHTLLTSWKKKRGKVNTLYCVHILNIRKPRLMIQ